MNDECLVILDADGQHNPDEIPLFNKEMEKGVDVVFGCRDFGKMPLRHRVANRIMTSTFNLLFRTKFDDLASGFIAVNKKFAKAYLKEFPDPNDEFSNRYNTDMLIKYVVWKNNFTYSQINITCEYHTISGIKRGVDIVGRIMLGMLRLRVGLHN